MILLTHVSYGKLNLVQLQNTDLKAAIGYQKWDQGKLEGFARITCAKMDFWNLVVCALKRANFVEPVKKRKNPTFITHNSLEKLIRDHVNG
mmetsp:Transcript_16484/g.19557  ORF Transcript_16484/g.19557 Transcript_16484/m.19557 type:complete len:91 (-) Transcript_16484:219-491(-)